MTGKNGTGRNGTEIMALEKWHWENGTGVIDTGKNGSEINWTGKNGT